MALTVTSNTTSVLTMDSTSDGGGTWTALGSAGTPALDPDNKVDGTNAVCAKLSAARGGFQVTSSVSRNFIDGSTRKGMVAFWAFTGSNISDTTNTGGITIRIGSTSAAYGEWQVATKTGAGGVQAYSGGYQRFVVDLTTSPNTTAGSPNYAAVVYWGIQFDVTSSVSGNIKNVFIDRLDILTAADIAAGTAACTVNGTTTANAMFGEIADHANNAPQAFIKRIGGVLALNQPIQIGTTSGTNTFTSKNESCVWQAQKVSDGFFFLKFVGGSGTDTITFGTKSGSGASAVGIDPTTIFSSSPRWSLTASGTNIETFQMYGVSFSKMTNCQFGTSSTALGTTGSNYGAISATLIDLSGQLTLNIGADTREENINRIVTSTNTTGALNLIDSTTIDVSDWQIINSPGFQNSGTAGTRTVTGHSFINAAANKPYVTIQDSASDIWNLNNPNDGAGGRPSVTDQTELAFTGNSNGTVNENYVVTWSVKTPGGTAINEARTKIVESAPSAAIANQNNTDSGGAVTSTYLRTLNVPSGATTLTITTHTPQAFKVYKYGYLPSVSSATINQPVTNNVAMLTDTFQAELIAATAITLGDTTHNVQVIDDRAATDYILILKYTSGSNTLTVGNTILSSGSGTWRGVVKQIIEGNSTAGTIVVRYSSGVAFSNSAGTLDNTPSSGTWTATYTISSVLKFAMGIDADTLTPQQLYDYVNAKLEASTLDTTKNFDDMVIWGKSAEGIPIQGIGSKFKTVRNDSATQQGWVIWNLGGVGLGGISTYMANDGSTFTPAATVTVAVNVKDESNNPVQSARVAVYKTSDMTELINTTTDSNGLVSTSYTYSSDVPVTIRVRKSTAAPKYIAVNTSGTIGSAGLNSTVTFVAEAIAESTTDADIGGDFTVNTTRKTITHVSGETPVYTVKKLYTWLMDYFDDSGLMDDTIPMTAQTPSEYTLVNGWFMDDTSTQFLKEGAIQTSGWTHPANTTGIRILILDAAAGLTSGDIGTVVQGGTTGDTGKLLDYNTASKKLWVRADATDDNFDDVDEAITVDGQACGNMTAAAVTGETIYSNIFTLGTLVSGTTMDAYQNDAQITPWWTSGHIDILVKVKEANVEIDSGNITVLARKYGTLYDHYIIDASSGRNPVPLASFADSNNETAEGTVGGYSGITFDFGASSHDVDGNTINEPYDVEINCGGLHLTEVYEYLKYVTRTSSAITFTGYGSIPGEYYTAVGDIRFAYDNEGGGGTAFSEGELITGTGGGTPTGYLVSLIDDGTTGIMVLRNVHGTFTNNQVITGGTTGRTAQVDGTPDSIIPSKQAPFGTFAGGQFFGARGVYLVAGSMHADDANNYQLVDSANSPHSPPTSVPLVIDGVASEARVSLFRAVDANGAVDKAMFTIDASQGGVGVSTIIINPAINPIPNDTPATGYLRVVRRDGSGNIIDEQRYTYTSWSGSTFTLSGTTSYDYGATDTVYVPYIDEQAPYTADPDGTSVSKSITYVADRDVVVRVRKKGYLPFEQKGRQITNIGFSATSTITNDSIVT